MNGIASEAAEALCREAAGSHPVIACEGDDQQPSQVGADQPLQAVGDRYALVTVSHQQAFAPGEPTVVSCSAHATDIGTTGTPA